ncbi:DUF7146 domain-containing protein [Sinorhizobium chiapasense]|uniref:Toprim domain-containing protein n=1 Tax=Sinorhizobium chiapasense TaxID=501572 RepID=A0ABZ2BFG5_9HYPH
MAGNNDQSLPFSVWQARVLEVAKEHAAELGEKIMGQAPVAVSGELRWRKNLSLSLNPRTGAWYDFVAQCGGGLRELVMHMHGLDKDRATEWLARELAAPPAVSAAPKPHLGAIFPKDGAQKIEAARKLYMQARPWQGTPAESYLRGRGLSTPESALTDLRFLSHCRIAGETRPCLIMPFRHPPSFEIRAVQRIALHPDGSAVRSATGHKLKMAVGLVAGSAMMLGRPGSELVICEGLETGLALLNSPYGQTHDGSYRPIWAVGGATFLKLIEPVAGVERVLFAADNDTSRVGFKAAMKGCRRWLRAGCDAYVREPDTPGTDFADLYGGRQL